MAAASHSRPFSIRISVTRKLLRRRPGLGRARIPEPPLLALRLSGCFASPSRKLSVRRFQAQDKSRVVRNTRSAFRIRNAVGRDRGRHKPEQVFNNRVSRSSSTNSVIEVFPGQRQAARSHRPPLSRLTGCTREAPRVARQNPPPSGRPFLCPASVHRLDRHDLDNRLFPISTITSSPTSPLDQLGEAPPPR